jgi:hypothetical protein
MISRKFALGAAALVALATVMGPAQARRHHHHHWRGQHLPYPVSYKHNYGPGYEPGTFAYYDGPSNNFCIQGAAAYRGQHGRHACF